MSDTPLRAEPLPVRDVRHPVTRETTARAQCQTPRYAENERPCAMHSTTDPAFISLPPERLSEIALRDPLPEFSLLHGVLIHPVVESRPCRVGAIQLVVAQLADVAPPPCLSGVGF
jgi:hypothetical protein